MWVRRFFGGLVGYRSELLDSVGLGLLSTAAFTWSVTAGFAVAGVSCLALSWWLQSEGE